MIIGFVDRDSLVGQRYQQHQQENIFYQVATFYSTDEVVCSLKEAGFGQLAFAQTIFRPLANIDSPEPVWDGYGQGSFVVVRALSRSPGTG